MHTSRMIRTDEFAITAGGAPATLEEVLPGLTTADRVAVVTHTPGGSLAAAPLLLAAVGRYYEELRRERDDFYRYPSYFVVHVGGLQAYHGWLDVWAEHKEVVVPANAEAVLDALHDRGVTRVLLEDVTPGPGVLMRETVNWLLEDVRDVLRFTPGVREGSLTVRPSEAAARLVRQAVDASQGLLPDETARRLVEQADLPQAFERISPHDALGLICGYGAVPGVIGQSEDYLARHGADARTMELHRYVVEGAGA